MTNLKPYTLNYKAFSSKHDDSFGINFYTLLVVFHVVFKYPLGRCVQRIEKPGFVPVRKSSKPFMI